MLSDILSQTVHDLDLYLNDPTWDDTYKGEMRERIVRLRDEAEYVRVCLDVPFRDELPSEAILRERIAEERRGKITRSLIVRSAPCQAAPRSEVKPRFSTAQYVSPDRRGQDKLPDIRTHRQARGDVPRGPAVAPAAVADFAPNISVAGRAST
jgi:hypothetical protein